MPEQIAGTIIHVAVIQVQCWFVLALRKMKAHSMGAVFLY